jgi:hypothetical protein
LLAGICSQHWWRVGTDQHYVITNYQHLVQLPHALHLLPAPAYAQPPRCALFALLLLLLLLLGHWRQCLLQLLQFLRPLLQVYVLLCVLLFLLLLLLLLLLRQHWQQCLLQLLQFLRPLLQVYVLLCVLLFLLLLFLLLLLLLLLLSNQVSGSCPAAASTA